MHNVVILVGNSRFSSSPFKIGHAAMRDAIDLPAVLQALESAGLSALDAPSQSRLVNVFAKPKPPPRGPFAASATRSSTIRTSTRRAAPARRSEG
jgi:cyanuric acid amidohydrolase